MKTSKQAIKWALDNVGKPAPGGKGHCQELVRTAYGLPAWATSAKLAFEHTPPKEIHTGTKWADIPAGAFVYYPTLSPYGHVTLSIGGGQVVSNDYPNKWGLIVKAPVQLPDWHGVEHFGGWSLWTPYGTVTL